MKKGKLMGKIFGIALAILMVGAMLPSGAFGSHSQVQASQATIYVPNSYPTIQATVDATNLDFFPAANLPPASADASVGTLIASGVLSDSYPRQLARTSDGAWHCVYHRSDGTYTQIYHSESTDGGETWTEEQVTTASLHHYQPSVAIDSNDNIHVAWIVFPDGDPIEKSYGYLWPGYPGYPGRVSAVQYRVKTSAWQNTEDVKTGYHTVLSIAVDSENNVHLVIGGHNPGAWNCEGINYTKRTASGWGPIERVSSGCWTGAAAIAIDENNAVHVVYGHGPYSEPRYEIVHRQRTSSGWGSEIQLQSLDNYGSSGISIAVDTNDHIHVVWGWRERQGDNYGIRYRKFTTFWEPIEILEGPTLYTQYNPAIATDSNDHIHVVWSGQHTDSPASYQLRYREYTSAWQPIENLTSSSSHNQTNPNLMWAFYPVVGGIKTNQPEDGCSFLWMDGTTVRYGSTLSPDDNVVQIGSLQVPAHILTFFGSEGRIVDTTFDKAEYSPGDTAEITVEAANEGMTGTTYSVDLYIIDPSGQVVATNDEEMDVRDSLTEVNAIQWLEPDASSTFSFEYSLPKGFFPFWEGATPGKYHVLAKLSIGVRHNTVLDYRGIDLVPPEETFRVIGEAETTYREGSNYRRLREEIRLFKQLKEREPAAYPVCLVIPDPDDPSEEINLVLIINDGEPIVKEYRKVTVKTPLIEPVPSGWSLGPLSLYARLPSSLSGCIETWLDRKIIRVVTDFPEEVLKEFASHAGKAIFEMATGVSLPPGMGVIYDIGCCTCEGYTSIFKESIAAGQELEVYMPVGLEISVGAKATLYLPPWYSGSTVAVYQDIKAEKTITVSQTLNEIEIGIPIGIYAPFNPNDFLLDWDDIEPLEQFKTYSPVVVRVYDSQNHVTGIVDGRIKNEIPNSVYDEENEIVRIFGASGFYRYEITGDDYGEYGATAIRIEGRESATTFIATEIATAPGAVHQYTIDWDALSEGEAGVTVRIDSDGDGEFEETVVTSQPNIPSNPSPANHATGVDINANLGWSGGDPDAGDTVTYDVYFGTSSTPPFRETIGPYPAAQSSITYDPGTLVDGTTYYWQIVARDNHGVTREGPVWDFSTGLPGPAVPWDLPWGLDVDPAAVHIWTYPGDAVAVTLASVEWSMPSGLLIWYYGGPIEGWRFYKNGWGASNTLETLIADKGYIGIVPTASVWEIPQG